MDNPALGFDFLYLRMVLDHYVSIAQDSYTGFANYLWHEITHPHWQNYFYWLTGISVFFLLVEWLAPWRKGQARFRKDFWLDAFYMYFNYFLFSLVVFHAASNIFVDLFNDFLAWMGVENLPMLEIASWPSWAQLLFLLVFADFLQWNIHRLLHSVPFLWRFHQVHHSVEQMGFAAHLRYHWMETVVYKSLQYLPLGMIGFGIDDFFIVYMFTTVVGHWNHANIKLNIGPLKYIFNNPQMHIWHHSLELPDEHPKGVNFAITLSIWDYLFGTAWIPRDGRDIPLGFPGLARFPKSFFRQFIHGWRRKKQPPEA